MKNLIVLSALTFSISQIVCPAAQAGAQRLLQAMPACKDFGSVKNVNNADRQANMAMSQADAALHSIKTFDNTCAATASGSTYNSDEQIAKITSDSKAATKTAASAVNALDAAIKAVTPIGNSLGAVGAGKDCVKEAKSLPAKLATKQKEVEKAMRNVESCVNRTSTVTTNSVSTVTSVGSGISGANPADHSHEESSCMPGDEGCVDRDPFGN